MNPEHLFDQADNLIQGGAGAPRQADLRRAISAVYYGVFHCVLRAAADRVVGGSLGARASDAYDRVYRSLDHSELKKRSQEARPLCGADIAAVADAIKDLQEKRHRADYEPRYKVSKSDVIAAIATARDAAAKLATATTGDREKYLVTILFKKRPFT
jgi:uncharacterized protein (UPF0332 family)